MKRVIRSTQALACVFFLAACGNEVLNKQDSHRSALGPELPGTWVSQCQGKQINRVTFKDDKMILERSTFFDPECQDPERTVRQTGTYKLAHNYKEGVMNAIIFHASSEVGLTLHTEYEVDAQNNNLAKIQNEKEQEIRAEMSPTQKKQIFRENLRLRAAKTLQVWQKNQEKALNRLQMEKLEGYGLTLSPNAEVDSRLSIRYEVDNGFLQFGAGGDFGRVYSRQP